MRRVYPALALACGVLLSGAAAASPITIITVNTTVSGKSNLWAWNGTLGPADTAGGDTAAVVAPVIARDDLTNIISVNITATGMVANGPGLWNANGEGPLYSHNDGAWAGLPDLTAPINSLIGAWIDENDFSKNTVFEIGTGGSFDVPDGATMLVLGTMDGYQWNNNLGSFDVRLDFVDPPPDAAPTPAPEPLTLSLVGAGLVGMGAMRRRRKAR